MTEDVLQFIWQHRLFDQKQLQSVSGKNLQVLMPGELNRDSGPDFFNARIKIDGLTLAGNVEVHVQSSDWNLHGHQKDKAYNTIILHVVYHHNKQLDQNQKYNVEVLELKNWVDPGLFPRMSKLLNTRSGLPCGSQLKNCSDLTFKRQLMRMLNERLKRRSLSIANQYNFLNEHYTQTYYGLLLRNFGFQLNAPAFELLSRALPLKILLRHADDLMQLETLLLGTAGLLEQHFDEEYPRQLQNEYAFLSEKYKLTPLDRSLLKYSRTRPGNFPDLRLAQFAMLIHKHPELLQAPQEHLNFKSLLQKLDISAGKYWQDHFRLQLRTGRKSGQLGKRSAELLIINSLAPFLWYYAKKLHREEFQEKALVLLKSCAVEDNRKTRMFKEKSDLLVSAAQSQACIELFDEYCSKKRCLECAVAAELLKTKG